MNKVKPMALQVTDKDLPNHRGNIHQMRAFFEKLFSYTYFSCKFIKFDFN
ncbi:MAG: hypothetical protein ABIN01_01935 [Ferruginibacter sp.]